MNDLIEIIPGLYLGLHNNQTNNIKGNIISINNSINSQPNVLNLSIDPTVQVLRNKLHKGKIDFNLINNFILKSYNNNENTIIFSNDLMIGSIICIQFIIKYLEIDLIESIYYVVNKININKNFLPKDQIFEIFINYISKN